ncbi:MAG: hypothetical protein V2I34_09880 [Bacteroidales bacterium]|jgi:hypothetical protein|nr:hypothetical protein [Bacteroidales bacterium]
MRNKFAIFLTAIFSLITLLSYSQSPFSAEMINVQRGTERLYKLQSNGLKYRYDFNESGMEGTVIVDPGAGKTAILLPEEKFVHYTEIHSSTSLMNDPYQAFIYSKSRYDEKKAGEEKVSGFNCNKTELYASDQLVYTAWYSEDLGFLLKLVNEMADNTYMELRDISKEDINDEVFTVPEAYIEVDRKMRPIIPEPPAPETWNKIEVAIPLKGEYKRGDLLSFKIPESINYKIILNNNTDNPAKIIRMGMRDGKELPDNEQGPLSYRTKRLYGGESYSNIYSWKAGDEKLIQVHEGVINIEILPENR